MGQPELTNGSDSCPYANDVAGAVRGWGTSTVPNQSRE